MNIGKPASFEVGFLIFSNFPLEEIKMAKNTNTIKGGSNNDLYKVHWQKENAKAIVLIVHGYGEHIERYNEVAEAFNAANYDVYGYDFRAHGRSEGTDCFMADFNEYLDDLSNVLDTITLDRPFFFYGHSVGALTTITYLLERGKPTNFKGCVFTGPALKVSEDLSPFLQKISPLVAAIAPKFKAAALPVDGISKVPEVQENYKKDPYIYSGKLYAAPANQILKKNKEMQQNFSKIDFPFLTMHGKDDTIIEPQSSELLYNGASSNDKEIIMWDNLAHEIMRSFEKEAVIGKMTEWIAARC